jgi:hypothetical protein
MSKQELPQVTDNLLDTLEYLYADPQACRVCGAPLVLADSQGMKYACTSDAASPYRNKHEAAGVTWRQAFDHYNDSVRYNPGRGDVHVLAVVAEVRRLRAWAAAVEATR